MEMLWKWIVTCKPTKGRAPVRARLQVEALEDRTVPSTLIGLTPGNRLLLFDSNAPGKILSSARVHGLGGGEKMVSLDDRPANGVIYGLSDRNRLYTLDPFSGDATLADTSL